MCLSVRVYIFHRLLLRTIFCFSAVGGSTNPCLDIYSGSHAGSEPETVNIVNFLKAKGSEFDAYLTIHSYGQMWLYPWGYTSAVPADYLDLVRCVFIKHSTEPHFNNVSVYTKSVTPIYIYNKRTDRHSR